MNAQTEVKTQAKEIKTKYFTEVCYMYEWLKENPQYKFINYNFTFAYGYCLKYIEK